MKKWYWFSDQLDWNTEARLTISGDCDTRDEARQALREAEARIKKLIKELGDFTVMKNGVHKIEKKESA